LRRWWERRTRVETPARRRQWARRWPSARPPAADEPGRDSCRAGEPAIAAARRASQCGEAEPAKSPAWERRVARAGAGRALCLLDAAATTSKTAAAPPSPSKSSSASACSAARGLSAQACLRASYRGRGRHVAVQLGGAQRSATDAASRARQSLHHPRRPAGSRHSARESSLSLSLSAGTTSLSLASAKQDGCAKV
jgi:hypothetical protein